MHHDENDIQEKRKEIYKKHKEDCNDADARKNLDKLLRPYTFTEINNSIYLIIESMSGNNTQKKLDLQVHLERLFARYNDLINTVLSAIVEVSYKIPSNVYNLKEALLDFAQAVDIENEYQTRTASSCFKATITRDLDAYQEFYDQGFEEGYAKARANIEKDIEEDKRFTTLDLE